MNQTFKEFLTEHGADPDTIQQATRYYLAERLGDISPQEMRQQLTNALEGEGEVNMLLRQLEADTNAVDEASLIILSSAWEEPDQTGLVDGAITDAKKKLPVIETGIIAIVAMYGMWLVVTGGIKRSSRTVNRNSDGSFEEKDTVDYYDSTGALSKIVDLFKTRMGL